MKLRFALPAQCLARGVLFFLVMVAAQRLALASPCPPGMVPMPFDGATQGGFTPGLSKEKASGSPSPIQCVASKTVQSTLVLGASPSLVHSTDTTNTTDSTGVSEAAAASAAASGAASAAVSALSPSAATQTSSSATPSAAASSATTGAAHGAASVSSPVPAPAAAAASATPSSVANDSASGGAMAGESASEPASATELAPAMSQPAPAQPAPLPGAMKALAVGGAQDGFYHGAVGADAATLLRSGQCATADGRVLRRRIVTGYFNVDHPSDANDLDDLGIKLPHELSLRLGQVPELLSARDAGNFSLLVHPEQAEPSLGVTGAKQLAQTRDVQFVVAGRVVSTAVTDRTLRLSLFESSNHIQPGESYQGPLSGMTGDMLKYRASARLFELELWIYDGTSGALLASQRLSTEAKGDVLPAIPVPFASETFWRTDYGRPVGLLLDRAVDRVVATVRCVPLAARVVRVASGGQIFLDAGGIDGLQLGDVLTVYRPDWGAALQASGSGAALGLPESVVGQAALVQVQPNLAIAQMRSDHPVTVNPGDIVRFVTPLK